MRLGDRIISFDQPPYVIAELGVNHDGSIERARQLVDAARDAGTDAIKLQYFEAPLLLNDEARFAAYQKSSTAPDPLQLLQSLELAIDDVRELIQRAHERSLHAIVTVFSLESVPMIADLTPDAFKIASPDIINRPLIESLMTTNRPLILSCGGATLDEVASATVWLGDHPHLLMQCVSAYPAPDEHAALNGRIAMLGVNPRALGYSDHTTAIDTGALAVATGARLLEKHLTHDRNASGPDHAASLEPDDLKEYVQRAHRAWRMCGPIQKGVLDIERDVREVSRQSITTTRALGQGHVISRDDVSIRRPGTGIPPALLEAVIGRTLAQDVEANRPLQPEMLA